ncbi:MAG: hypothetical protein AAF292_14160 [Pseudomonadota bacterium]
MTNSIQDLDLSVKRKVFTASVISGTVKGLVPAAVAIIVLGTNDSMMPILIILACTSLSMLLEYLTFYKPNMKKHNEHIASGDERYVSALKKAISDLGPYKMINTNWFLNDIDEMDWE